MIGALGHHYGGLRGCGYSNLSIQIIEMVKQGDHSHLAKREVHWQNEMFCPKWKGWALLYERKIETWRNSILVWKMLLLSVFILVRSADDEESIFSKLVHICNAKTPNKYQ